MSRPAVPGVLGAISVLIPGLSSKRPALPYIWAAGHGPTPGAWRKGVDCSALVRLCLAVEGYGFADCSSRSLAEDCDLLVDATQGEPWAGVSGSGLVSFYGYGWGGLGHVRWCVETTEGVYSLGSEHGDSKEQGTDPDAGVYVCLPTFSAPYPSKGRAGAKLPIGTPEQWGFLGVGRLKAEPAREPVGVAELLLAPTRGKLPDKAAILASRNTCETIRWLLGGV